MNEVNNTLFIPLYGKSQVSRRGIILNDPMAEKICSSEQFPIRGRSASKWLAFNMAMRARVFDDWTDTMLSEYPDAVVLHIGCGLDSRCLRVGSYSNWIDCDFPDVIKIRRKYYAENEHYHMMCVNAADPGQVRTLPDHDTAIVVLEGISMYLSPQELHAFLQTLQEKYAHVHILMDIYTAFGAKASARKNPVNDVGVTTVYGIDDIESILSDLRIRHKAEHSFTPPALIRELKPLERLIFRLLFTGKMYRRIYRLLELEAAEDADSESAYGSL